MNTPLPTEGPQAPTRSAGLPSRNGACLPADWRPSEELFAYGAERGLSRAATAEILENMRLWAIANRNRPIARKADWDATAKGFIRRDAVKFQARAGPMKSLRNGVGTLLAKSYGAEHERGTEKTIDLEAVRLLPGDDGR